MNIVWLTPEFPYPANSGGRIVVYNRIKQLSNQGNSIYLISIVDDMEEVDLQELKKICADVTLINRNNKKITNIIKTIKTPYCVASRTFSEIVNKINELLGNNLCDIIICEFPQMALNILNIGKEASCKCILSLHNIESNSMNSLAINMRNIVKKCIYKIEALRLRSIENKLMKLDFFDAVCFVSNNDMEIFKRRYPEFSGKLWLSPIGSDEYKGDEKMGGKNIIFVGKMDYQPNIVGVKWFTDKVFPKILSEIPDAMLYIVGKNPVDDIKKLENAHIVVTGTVESVKKYYEMASVAVLPIFDGGGVKTKLIEAISYKVPVVSTAFGILGTMFEKDEDVIVADVVEEFAVDVIQCIQGSNINTKMLDKAYNKFKLHYTWKGICTELQRNLENL